MNGERMEPGVTTSIAQFNRFVSLVALTLTLSGTAAAQDRQSASEIPSPLQTLPCDEFWPQKFPNPHDQVPFGIPDAQWTPDLFVKLRVRAQECAEGLSPNQRSTLRAHLANLESNVLPRAAQKRAGEAAVQLQTQEVLNALDQIRATAPASERLKQLQDFERNFSRMRLPADARSRIVDVLLRDRADAEAQERVEAGEQAKLEQVRQAEREARAREHELQVQRQRAEADAQRQAAETQDRERQAREQASATLRPSATSEGRSRENAGVPSSEIRRQPAVQASNSAQFSNSANSSHTEDILWLIFFILPLAVGYAAPTIVAFKRKHPNRYVIAAINLVGGMTGFLWIMTLIWAFRAAHISEVGSNGGESGINLVANDSVQVAVARDKPAQLSELKTLLDAGEITTEQYQKIRAEIVG